MNPGPTHGTTNDVVIVANRLPIEQRPDGTYGRSPGGLASALAAVTGERTQWIGWAGQGGAFPEHAEIDGAQFHAIDLNSRQLDDYYHGFANSLLWPLFHGRLRQPQMNRSWWRGYREVNERFANEAASVTPPGGTVWVHDYHLLLCPAMIRARRRDVRIGLFLHIPFPSIELFASLPWRGDLVRGMTGADLIGFQTDQDAANAATAVERFAGEQRPSSCVPTIGHGEIETFPISIDFEHWADLGQSSTEAARLHRHELDDADFVFAGVDRLDYTKGIDQRLRAFHELIDDGLLDPKGCRFVQISVPSRADVPDYGDERIEVERIVDETNNHHRFADGSGPVLHITSQLDETELAGWYRAADALVVTSYADGMNLVAKEFVASRPDLEATVVLSEFTGAAHDLTGALLVNPYDTDAVKRAMLNAFRMGSGERAERMRTMRQSVRTHDVHLWARSFLGHLQGRRLRSIAATGGD